MAGQYDVIVVGYGPTGLVLASTLGQAGHKVAVVERWPQLYGMPRLSHIDDETARIIQASGDVDAALGDSHPILGYRFVNAAGELLTEVGQGKVLGPCGYPADISMFQPDIEDAIDARIAACPSVDRFMGYEAAALAQDDGGVTLTIRPTAEGEEQVLRARYLVGCDGARSFVRDAVGITRTDFGFNERWLNIDMEVLRPIPERFAQTIQYCDPARGHMHLPIGSKRLRVEVALLPGEDAADFLKPEFAWRWLRERHGLTPDDVKFIRQIVYTFEARSADSWRVGRVLLGGDACHTMPPYLGQGACSGMRDGINLGWRLDLVLRSVASPDLLDGYEAERKPHVTTLTHMAIGLGKIANEHDPVKAAARDEGMRTHKPAKPPFPYLQTGLLDPEGSPMTGRIWPQGRVRADGREGRFDDVVGGGFVLLSRAPADLAPETAARLDALGCKRVSFDQFEDLDGVYARFFDEQGIACILARPDFVTFGTRADASGAQELARAVLAGLDAPGGHA